MKEATYRIIENIPLTAEVWRMRLQGDTSAFTAPGQFMNIALPGLYLRRPISLCDLNNDELTIVYKKVGKGTTEMTELKPGQDLDILSGLGNGYDLSFAGDAPLLIGGGVGVPPLFLAAKRLLEQGKKVRVILGFNTKSEIFYADEFRALGAEVCLTTVDGSDGIKGFVTDAMKELEYSYFYACGPMPMLHAVNKTAQTSGEFSFEERMGCGFGACLGCSCKTVNGYKRICKDGPVLKKEEILWED